jgi:hypothetical protein
VTDEAARNNAASTRGRPFPRGNPGRPHGARNKTTLAMEALLEGEAEALTRKAVEMALAGDTTAMRLCLDRILPPRKDRYVEFEMPTLKSPADAVKASAALCIAVAEGALTPSEAGELAKLVDGYLKAVDLHDIQQRLDKLEAAQESKR